MLPAIVLACGLACDFARNLAKHGIATWSDVTEWGTGEVLTREVGVAGD